MLSVHYKNVFYQFNLEIYTNSDDCMFSVWYKIFSGDLPNCYKKYCRFCVFVSILSKKKIYKIFTQKTKRFVTDPFVYAIILCTLKAIRQISTALQKFFCLKYMRLH